MFNRKKKEIPRTPEEIPRSPEEQELLVWYRIGGRDTLVAVAEDLHILNTGDYAATLAAMQKLGRDAANALAPLSMPPLMPSSMFTPEYLLAMRDFKEAGEAADHYDLDMTKVGMGSDHFVNAMEALQAYDLERNRFVR